MAGRLRLPIRLFAMKPIADRPVQAETQAKKAEPLNPYPLKQRLDEQAAQEEIQGLVQFSFFRPHLADLLQASAQAHVDVLVLKGAALAETLYPRPSLRAFGDIDLLIRVTQATSVRTVLETLGYVTDLGQWEDLIHGRGCQANFFQHTGRGPVVVELHTRLVNNSLFFPLLDMEARPVWETEQLWQRARPVLLAGVPACVLGPEDQLLHLCLHLAGHYLAAPQSLRDIAQLCDAVQQGVLAMDWSLFLALAREVHSLPACFCGLYVARSLLGASVPDEVMDTLSPGQQRLAGLAAARAVDLEQTQTEPLRLPILWHLMGSPRVRLSAARRILFPSWQWLVIHYYYDLFDTPEAPRLLEVGWHHPLRAVPDAMHILMVYLALSAAHGRALASRLRGILFGEKTLLKE